MIDKQLIAMCDCPEIWDRWEPKVGDSVWHSAAETETVCMDKIGCRLIDTEYALEYGIGETCLRDMVTYIPRIEDVLEWLGRDEGFSTIETIIHEWIKWDSAQAFLILLLKAYMHLEHNKTWNGEAWV